MSSQVVVESSKLVSDSPTTCAIQGTVFNNSEITAQVELTFRALEVDGRQTADAHAGVFGSLAVPPHSRAKYDTGAIYRAEG